MLDIISELPKGFTDLTWGKKFKVKPREIYLIGGSFGGPAVILAGRDKRVAKVVAVAPVVDWKILTDPKTAKAETSNPSYVDFLHQAFGNGYRVSAKDWNKLHTGKFYNPVAHVNEIDGAKLMMYHAKDDPVVSARDVMKFAKRTKTKLILRKRGGHLSSMLVMKPAEWKRINKFFKS